MISDKERRKVAKLLRDRAGYEMGCVFKELYGDCNSAGPTCGECNERAMRYVADLIEPEPERTCRMVSAFDTDELEGLQEIISFSPEDTLAYRCERCGFDFRYERGLYPSYCPNCGAKVISE